MALPKSCSSCRFRKIKCDRREKLKEANAPDDSDVKCSHCQSSGTSCAFLPPPTKKRLGKRIRALRDLEHNELLYPEGGAIGGSSSSSSSATTSNTSTSTSNSQVHFTNPRNGSLKTLSISSLCALPLSRWAPTPSLSTARSSTSSSTTTTTAGQNLLKPGMFGIRGLTRHLLESCIAAYLLVVSPTSPIIRIDSFLPRLRAFSKLYSGELPESEVVEPLDDLLVIACACSGAACLNALHEPVSGSERRFEIRADLMTLFVGMVESENGQRLERAGLDGVVACYLVSIVSEDYSRESSFRENRSLKISPTSTEGVVRMAMARNLHIMPPENEPTEMGFISGTNAGSESVFPLESEGTARTRIWWCILGNDVFRALAYRRPFYITDHSFDHGINSKLPPSVLKGLPVYCAFEFQWLYSMATITFLARSILPTILSERSQRKGVDVNEVWSVIENLNQWRKDLPQEVTWEAQHQEGVHGTGEAVRDRAFKCRLKAAYIECLFHFLVLATSYGLEDSGFRNYNDQVVERIAPYLPKSVNQPISTASVRAASSSNSSSPTDSSTPPTSESAASNPSLSQALNAVESLANTTFDRLADLLPQVSLEGMVRASVGVFRELGTAAIIWATETAVRRATQGRSSEEFNGLLDRAENLISSVASCDSSKNTPLVVKQMKEIVSKARLSVKEILNNGRNCSMSTTTTTATSTSNQSQNDRNPNVDFASTADEFMTGSFGAEDHQQNSNLCPPNFSFDSNLRTEMENPQWLTELSDFVSENQGPIFPNSDSRESRWMDDHFQ